MIAIHTFADKHNVIWKELLYNQYLSAILAKKHYGELHFYCTPELKQQVVDLELPYDIINTSVVTNNDLDTWSIPKLKVFAQQQKPFIHLDTDTLLFKKPDFNKTNSDFIFSHLDLEIKNTLTELVNHRDTYDTPEGRVLHSFNESYTNLFFKLYSRLDNSFIKNVNFETIPNMNIIVVKNPTLFRRASITTLQDYYKFKNEIDSEEFGPCYIEQFTLHTHLRTLSPEYKIQNEYNAHLYFDWVPFSNKKDANNIADIDNYDFPMDLEVRYHCDCCQHDREDRISIKDRKDIGRLLDYEFGGFLHTTYQKWYDYMQAIIINKLRKEIGDEKLQQIHDYFKIIYPELNLPIKSGGEKLYEELTGFKFK